jgi:hypothetical protein
MAYIINRTNGTQLTVVEDGTIDQTTDLKLVGKNYAGYGEIQNENLVALLENFASGQQPTRAISGQIWFDSNSSKLKFYDGTKFRTTGGAEVSTTQPVGLTEGDFWWDTANNQLYANAGTGGFVLIGPQSTGDSVSQMVTKEVRDTTATLRTIITAVVNDETLFTISSEQFTIDSSDPANAITGFDVIRKGVTLRNTPDAGVTSSDHRFWGTATNALKLGGVDAANFIQSEPGADASFNSIARFIDDGLTIGTSNDLLIAIEEGTQGKIVNQVGNELRFHVTSNNQEVPVAKVDQTGFLPMTTLSYDLGSTNFKWNTVYAQSFNGLATSSNAIRVSGTDYTGSVASTANTVAVRDADGDVYANLFQGTATTAKYADLAEMYASSEDLPVGTAVAVGGDAEIRPAKASEMCIGTISDNPAYLMNADADGQAVALKGRVPVRVKGPVSKGQPVYAWADGVCTTIASTGLVGIALESSDDDSEKLIECVLKV